MARIINENIGAPGVVTTAASANTKFTDVTTATTNLDATNIKSRGIHAGNISDPNLVIAMNVPAAIQASAAIVSDGSNDVEIPALATQRIDFGGSGRTLIAGDVLRIHFMVTLESHNGAGGAGAFEHPDAALDEMAVAFPQWDLVSNAGANFTIIPKRADLAQTRAINEDIIIENYNGAQTNYMTDGCAVFSYNSAVFAGGLQHTKQTSQGMLVYEHPTGAANLTVFAISLFFRGRLRYQHDAVTGRVFKCISVGSNLTHNLGIVNLSTVHMRNG
ncbi:MAG: hypothetical protein KAJ19_11840 [Gammaproteobacteria bacterium]|nr:hypothetical protein [Gammaproteobacteria bacterium]